MGAFISIIVPVYNDPEGITTTLRALTKQRFQVKVYEIIVCDNGSTDTTQAIVQQYEDRYPDLVRLVVEDEQRSSYAARNKGIEAARGEILAFVDADMWMAEDWLSQVSDKMGDDDVEYLGCNVEIVTAGNSLVGRHNALFGFRVREYLERDHFAPTCCLVIRRAILDRVGLFDDRLFSGGDRLFGNRVHAAGIRQHFAEDITLYHPARETLGSLTRKGLRVGRGNYRLARQYRDRCEKVQLRFGSFLPVRPGAYLGSVKAANQAEQLSLLQHIMFYSVSCYTKWVRTLGYIYEAIVLAFRGAPS